MLAAGGAVDRMGREVAGQTELLQLLGRGRVGLTAVFAQDPDEALREARYERRADEERLDALVDESGDCTCGVVRVDR